MDKAQERISEQPGSGVRHVSHQRKKARRLDLSDWISRRSKHPYSVKYVMSGQFWRHEDSGTLYATLGSSPYGVRVRRWDKPESEGSVIPTSTFNRSFRLVLSRGDNRDKEYPFLLRGYRGKR